MPRAAVAPQAAQLARVAMRCAPLAGRRRAFAGEAERNAGGTPALQTRSHQSRNTPVERVFVGKRAHAARISHGIERNLVRKLVVLVKKAKRNEALVRAEAPEQFVDRRAQHGLGGWLAAI